MPNGGRNGRGERRSTRKYLKKIKEVRHSVKHFLQREMGALLDECNNWKHEIQFGDIRLASNSVSCEIKCPAVHEDQLWIVFELQSGWLIGYVSEYGWMEHLEPTDQRILRNAIVGLFKLGHVDLAADQITAAIGPDYDRFDITNEGMVVWQGNHFERSWRYEMHKDRLQPIPAGTVQELPPPEFDPDQLMFKRIPIGWQEWVDIWEDTNKNNVRNLLAEQRIVPVGIQTSAATTAAQDETVPTAM